MITLEILSEHVALCSVVKRGRLQTAATTPPPTWYAVHAGTLSQSRARGRGLSFIQNAVTTGVRITCAGNDPHVLLRPGALLSGGHSVTVSDRSDSLTLQRRTQRNSSMQETLTALRVSYHAVTERHRPTSY